MLEATGIVVRVMTLIMLPEFKGQTDVHSIDSAENVVEFAGTEEIFVPAIVQADKCSS